MSISIHFVSALQPSVGNREIIEVNGLTIGECLNKAINQFPSIKNKIFARNGRLLKQIGIYINGKNASPNELARATKDGDDVYILEIFTGG